MTGPTSHHHTPSRPSWRCTEDNHEWPCSLARKALREAFAGNELGLARQMAWLMVAAARDLQVAEPAKLYRRFVRWTSDDMGPCGRCGKAGHEALPGLPPRLFPCAVSSRYLNDQPCGE